MILCPTRAEHSETISKTTRFSFKLSPGCFRSQGHRCTMPCVVWVFKALLWRLLIFIVNLTRFRVSRRPHSGCVYDGVSRGSYLRRRGLPWVWPTLSCELDPETEFGKWERQMSISSHVSQLPDRESDAHTPAQCSCPLVLHHTVPHSQTKSQNKLVFPQVACLSVFLFTVTRITNTNCWFAELSVLAGLHRLTAAGRG